MARLQRECLEKRIEQRYANVANCQKNLLSITLCENKYCVKVYMILLKKCEE